jgi:LacI family transcriptional regulator
MVISHIADPFFWQLADGVELTAAERGYSILLRMGRNDSAREIAILEDFQRRRVDGIVIASNLIDQYSKRLTSIHIPVVAISNEAEGLVSVTIDEVAAARMAADHLLALGHTRIGAITGPSGWMASEERLNGYHAALVAAGIAPDPALVRRSNFEFEEGYAAAAALLDLPDRPTAIFGFNDDVAVATLRAARERGIRVPEELSVVGFDDSDQARIVTPTLTTVRQPLAEMGRMAVSLLTRLIEGQRVEALRVELATRLVVRESTAPTRN